MTTTLGASSRKPTASTRANAPAPEPLWKRMVSRVTAQGPNSNRHARNLLIITTSTLVVIGLMMVLSASSVELVAAGDSPYETFIKQLMWVGLGSVVLIMCAFIPFRAYRKLSWLILFGGFGLALLVFSPLGWEVQGNRNWIKIGSFTAQPSEFLKLSIILWGSAILARKAKLLGYARHMFIPVVPGAAIAIGLVIAGKDLGTAMILGLIIAALFFFAGASIKLFVAGTVIGLAGTIIAVVSSPNRMERIDAWLNPTAESMAGGLAYQGAQARYGLAGGDMFGVGIGQSRLKVNWIPEAHNDFVFAVLGEEFGFTGTLLVILLFALLAYSIYRISKLANDLYATYVCGSILVWIIGQAILNIAVVTGMVPVIGIPLPFISYGGSSMIALLAAVGVLISCSRSTDTSSRTGAAPGRRGTPAGLSAVVIPIETTHRRRSVRR